MPLPCIRTCVCMHVLTHTTHAHTSTERIICPDLSIMNGVVGTSPPGRVFMSRTIYTCNDDFALKGDGNRVCQMNSTWNGTDPECGKWFLLDLL